MANKKFLFAVLATALALAVFVGCPIELEERDPLEGTWRGDAGDFYITFKFGSGTVEAIQDEQSSYEVSYKGTYTASGGILTMTFTLTKDRITDWHSLPEGPLTLIYAYNISGNSLFVVDRSANYGLEYALTKQ